MIRPTNWLRALTSFLPPTRAIGLKASTLAIAMLLAGAGAASAQQHQVSGRVTNPELAPVAGVNVVVKGTTIGTITNVNGNFSLMAPSAADTLVFSALGSAPQEVAIGGRSSINVTLEQRAIALEGLVVVGYGSQAREVVTGSVSQINSEEITRTSATTAGEALVGKVAGINTRMTTAIHSARVPSLRGAFTGREPMDGRPGSAPQMQIRNLGDPLFVIDGVPQDAHDFNHLNASDIETISILKDASASVYGFRAANGVVLVTTKRGSALQRPQLRVDGYYGWQNLIRERAQFGWANNAYQFKYSIIESQQNLGQPRSISPAEMELWRQGGPGYETYPSFPMFINRPNAPQANLNVTLSGGAGPGNSSYYFSVGHVDQAYVMTDNDFRRTNFQSNLQSSPFDGLTIGAELRGRLEESLTVAITEQVDALDIYFQGIQSSWPFEDQWANHNRNYIRGDQRYLARSAATMARDIGGTQDQFRRFFSGNLWTQYSFPYGIDAKATYSYTVNNHQFDIHRYNFDAYCYDAATDTYNVCAQYLGKQRQHLREQQWGNFGQIQLTHSAQLGSHAISTVGAFEISGNEGTSTETRSVPPTNFSHLINQVDITGFTNDWYINRRASYVGRVNYDYKQKYLLEALGRYDGSYLYSPDNRWGFFPGISAGWRITEEPFFRDRVPFLDELKLRVSWGQAGREQTLLGNAIYPQPWAYLEGATYGVGTGSVFDQGQVTGIRPRGLPVTQLSWVTSTSRNVGLDFAMLGGKLSGEVDLFERKLTGLPAARYDVVLPNEVGYTLPNENLESEANQGIDGVIRYSDRYKNVTYSIAPNATLARRRILDRYKPRYGNSWLEYRNGTEHRWVGANFRYNQIGQFQTMEEIANYPVDHDGRGNTTLLPGDHIYEDVNNDGFIDDLDLRVMGFGTGQIPILSFGLNGTFGYGAFTLSYDWAGGGLYSALWGVYAYTSDHNGALANQSRWRRIDPYNDNSEWVPGKFEPSRKGVNNHSSRRNSDFTMTNVKFAKLKRVELGYSVPAELGNKLGISSARLYTSITNPLIIDNYGETALDPEGTNNGFSYTTSTVATVGFSTTLGGSATSAPVVPVPPVGDD